MGAPFSASDPQPQFPNWARPRGRARHGRGRPPSVCAPSSSSGPRRTRGAPTTCGSALPSPPVFILLPAVYLARRRPFSALPNPLLALQQTPTPEALAPTPLPPIVWPVLIVRCPVASVAPTSSPIVLSLRLRFPAPAPLVPHLSVPVPLLLLRQPGFRPTTLHKSRCSGGKSPRDAGIQAPSSEEPRHPRAPGPPPQRPLLAPPHTPWRCPRTRIRAPLLPASLRWISGSPLLPGNPRRFSVDPGIGAPLLPSIPSLSDPSVLFCFPSGKPELTGVSVPLKGAGSPPTSTHPQKQQQQQQARWVHGASRGTCPHHPPPVAAPGFQLVRSADR